MKFLGMCYTGFFKGRLDNLPIKDLDLYLMNYFPLEKQNLENDFSKAKITYSFPKGNVNVLYKILHGIKFTFDFFRLARKYDAFLFVTPAYFHFLTYLFANLFGKKTVTIVADAYYEMTKDPSFDNLWLYAFRRLFFWAYWIQEYVSIKNSSAVFVNSVYLYNKYKKWNENTHYVPNGTDVKSIIAAKPKPYTNTDYILYIGTFSPFRGMDLLINAFKDLKKSYEKPIKLVIMGKRNPKIEAMADDPDVIIADHQPLDKVFSYTKAAKIGVISNYNTLTSQTISSIKGFIYMAALVPQLVTDSGDHAYWTRKYNTGIVVKDNAASIRDGLFKLLTDKRAYQLYKMNCKKYRSLVDYSEVKKPLFSYLKKLDAKG